MKNYMNLYDYECWSGKPKQNLIFFKSCYQSDTFTLYMVMISVDLYLFLPVFMILTLYQGHSSARRVIVKVVVLC